MSFSSSSIIKPTNLSLSSLNPTRHSLPLNRYSPSVPNARTPAPIRLSLVRRSGDNNRIITSRLLAFTEPDHHGISGGGGGENGGGENGGGGNGGDENGRDEAGENNKAEAMMVLAKMGREMESLPADLAAAIVAGKIPKVVVERFFELERSGMMKWLLQFTGFRERLLADDLFFAKVFIECGVGMFTKTAAEYQKRKENFFNELEVVFADVGEVFTRSERFITAVDVLNGPVFIVDCLLQVMAVIADFMLVYLPAPTVALRPPLNVNAGSFAKFFYSCPDNAFQVALAGTSYSFVQRFGAVVRNGAKLFAVGTASSLVGTAVTNTLINAKKAVDKSGAAEEVENIPVLATSVAYGVYMSVSSNLRYQLLAGVIEQRILEPALHQHKLLLSAVCFAVRTGNTFLGSLLWVDYARLIGLQKPHEVDSTHSTA